jgi:Animal haem peroxidase
MSRSKFALGGRLRLPSLRHSLRWLTVFSLSLSVSGFSIMAQTGPAATSSLDPATARQALGHSLAAFRSIDGSGNNLGHPSWGSAGSDLLRMCGIAYGDGSSSPAGSWKASPRLISNLCVAQPGSLPNAKGASDYLWQWGQFIDHDLTLMPDAVPTEPFDILVPTGDPFFDPFGTGTQAIQLGRSVFHMVGGVRQQFNVNTAYIDGSMVYGSDPARALELRTLDGTGRLKTSAGNLLPFNVHGFPNLPADQDPSFFLAGDVRANEQVGLTSMHTLFMREHNFWADTFHSLAPWLNDDQIYLRARAMVGAEIQAITYNEFLPVLLGPRALGKYAGYQPAVDATIANEFSSAAYRVGHTLLSPQILRLQRDGQTIPAGNLALRNAFFNPNEILANGGVEPVLRGLAAQRAQEVDNYIVDDVRNFLFGPPGAGGFDLASLNIQRGREHGLPGYNQVRQDLGLTAVSSFAEINPNPAVIAGLAQAYASVDDIDLWVGGLAEQHVPGAMVGETFYTILTNQFRRARDGDRFWYENYLPPALAQLANRQTLATIIRRNTTIGSEIQNNVFMVK